MSSQIIIGWEDSALCAHAGRVGLDAPSRNALVLSVTIRVLVKSLSSTKGLWSVDNDNGGEKILVGLRLAASLFTH